MEEEVFSMRSAVIQLRVHKSTRRGSSVSTTKSEDQVEGGLLLDVVVGESAAILELLAGEDESLLIGRDAFLILDLGLHVLDGVTWLDLEGDGLSGKGLHEDLHTTSESEDEMESGFLLDVVVGEGSSILELLSSEDKSLRISLQALFVLDYLLNFLNGVSWLDLEGDGLSVQSYDKDLHHGVSSSFGRVHLVKNGEMLNVVIG